MLLFIKKANFAKFADDSTIHVASKDITTSLELLKSESEEAINWFETNHVYANPDKFQAILVHHNKSLNIKSFTFKVNNIIEI